MTPPLPNFAVVRKADGSIDGELTVAAVKGLSPGWYADQPIPLRLVDALLKSGFIALDLHMIERDAELRASFPKSPPKRRSPVESAHRRAEMNLVRKHRK